MKSLKSPAKSTSADYKLATILSQPNGFEKIALELIPTFIKETRDYEGFARKILKVDPINSDRCIMIGSEPYVQYNKDFNSHAAIYGDDAQIPSLKVEGEQVDVGIITISSDDVTISEKRLLTQRYPYLERLKDLSGQVIAVMEDIRLLNMAEYLLKGNGTDDAPENDDRIITTPDTMLVKEHFVLLKKKFSDYDIPLARVVMNPSRLDDTLAWTSSGDRGDIDPQTHREMLQTGVRTGIWGTVEFITSRIVDDINVYGFSSMDFTGYMPVLKDVSARLTATDNKLVQGLFLYEYLGFFLASQRAVAKLVMGFTDGDDKIHIYDESNVKTKMFAKEIQSLGERV